MAITHGHLAQVPMTPTLILLAVSAALVILAGWRGARPPDLVRGPRMTPWRFIMLFSGAVTVLLMIHVGSLLGLHQAG